MRFGEARGKSWGLNKKFCESHNFEIECVLEKLAVNHGHLIRNPANQYDICIVITFNYSKIDTTTCSMFGWVFGRASGFEKTRFGEARVKLIISDIIFTSDFMYV